MKILHKDFWKKATLRNKKSLMELKKGIFFFFTNFLRLISQLYSWVTWKDTEPLLAKIILKIEGNTPAEYLFLHIVRDVFIFKKVFCLVC